MSAVEPARRVPGPDLTARLVTHRVFRTEFGLLAAALVAPHNERHAELLADQVDRVARLLHHHHAVEDAVIWPTLRGLAPHAAPALARLEEQHDGMGPLLVEARDRRLPARRRAQALRSLHALLCAHLDEEERVALPLLRAHVTMEQHEQWLRDLRTRMGVREQLAADALVATHADATERARMEAGAPAVLRLMLRWFVEPSYARRRRTLYGIG